MKPVSFSRVRRTSVAEGGRSRAVFKIPQKGDARFHTMADDGAASLSYGDETY